MALPRSQGVKLTIREKEMNFRFLSNHFQDLDRFSSINLTDPDKPIYFCNPVCYFYLKDKKMMPVAIQLTANEEDPIFTPSDGVFERVLNFFTQHWF